MKKTVLLALTLALCLAAMGANALTMTGLESDTVGRQWENHLFFSRMQALTGVEIQAHGVSDKAEYAALIDCMLTGGAAHDVLFKANLSRGQEIALADSGAIIDLAPHIAQHMPNLSALLEAHPQWREIISLEDGHIVSLPLLNKGERQAIMWINRAWLEKLGLAMPRTLEELTANTISPFTFPTATASAPAAGRIAGSVSCVSAAWLTSRNPTSLFSLR